jgi:hypothetical protein
MAPPLHLISAWTETVIGKGMLTDMKLFTILLICNVLGLWLMLRAPMARETRAA